MKLLILKYNKEYILGMGDVIDCVPLIYRIALTQEILLPIQASYEENIRSFFSQYAKISFYPIPDMDALHELEKSMECIRIENNEEYIKENKLKGHTDIKGLYHKAGWFFDNIDYSMLITEIPAYSQYKVPERPYAFIPEGGSSGNYRIDRKYVDKNLEVITPPQNALMLKYADIVKNATEIHCHATSWQRLIDKIPTNGKLFMHHYARETRVKPEDFEFSKKWTPLL
jgi:hypothetical protein